MLIAAQIALTFLMLAGAGAAIQGFLKTMHTPLGYDPHSVMSVGIPLHDGTYKTWARALRILRSVTEEGRDGPGRHNDGDLQQCHATRQWLSDAR